MSKQEIEGIVLLLDVGICMSTRKEQSTYLQSCIDIVQMIIQRKMFQSSKDEIGLVLFGTRDTANRLWDGESDHYTHVTVARQLSIVDWKLLEFVQNEISVSNLDGDVLDGLVVASDHFHEDINKKKNFKEKRIILLTDFSCQAEDDEKLDVIIKGLRKHQIRVDLINPFNESDLKLPKDQKSESKPTASNTIPDYKLITKEQLKIQALLKKICDETDGAIYSFDEVLTLLSTYQSKSIKSSGTKYTMQIGDSFKLPIQAVIRCKENKPELFRLKKVYAKDETVELKIDRARFTKDEEQRDLDDKTDVVDAYKYGSTYVPIDDPDSLKLKVEKCFTLLGFTKSENIRRHYFLSDCVYQIVPDLNAGEDGEEAFLNLIHAMYVEEVYGMVRRVFSSRSTPELGCLIPYITKQETSLFYIALPYEDDLRKFTLDNFNSLKKFAPNHEQLNLIDELIDSMDLSKKVVKKEDGENSDEEEEEEAYDPHTTFNPNIQRMFQSIALRATDPKKDLPDFDKHITNTHLSKIGERVRSGKVESLLKRCGDLFPTRIYAKKVKKTDENIFDKKKTNDEEELNEGSCKEEDLKSSIGLDELLNGSATTSARVKKIGTVTPAEDFASLAERLNDSEFEDLCVQLQQLIKELFNESLQSADQSSEVFRKKSVDCVRVQREFCAKRKMPQLFNTYLKTFKTYLLNEAQVNNKKLAGVIEEYWLKYFRDENLSLIIERECEGEEGGVSVEEANEFVGTFLKPEANEAMKNEEPADVEDLLDLM